MFVSETEDGRGKVDSMTVHESIVDIIVGFVEIRDDFVRWMEVRGE